MIKWIKNYFRQRKVNEILARSKQNAVSAKVRRVNQQPLKPIDYRTSDPYEDVSTTGVKLTDDQPSFSSPPYGGTDSLGGCDSD